MQTTERWLPEGKSVEGGLRVNGQMYGDRGDQTSGGGHTTECTQGVLL